MKKKITYIFLSLLLASNSFALGSDFWNAIFDGCYNGSDKTKLIKSYCTCYTNKFDKKYNDEEMIIFLEATEGTDLTKHPLVKRFAKECIDELS